MDIRARRGAVAGLALLLAAGCAQDVEPQPAAADVAAAPATCGWVGAWGSSQQLVEPRNMLPVDPLEDVTIRQTIRPLLAGSTVRLRLSNEFGDGPLEIGGVTLAKAAAAGVSEIAPETLVRLTFSGEAGVTIPQGAAYYSDPVAFDVVPFEDIAVTTHVVAAPTLQSGHPGSRTTSYYRKGEALAAASLPDAERLDHWYFIAGLDVMADTPAASIGVIGDSITDGRGSTTNMNDRWTDFLAARLQGNEATQAISVINLGLGGNRILNPGLGPAVLARLDRDVLAQPNMRYLIVFEGINDIGTFGAGEKSQAELDDFVERVTAAYEQIADRAHAKGVKVYGATIAPFGSTGVYAFNEQSESLRARLNAFIRESGTFDAVLDFDAVLADPERPTALLPEYDIGDGLHPSPAGFEAIAASVPLDLFPAPADCE